MQSTVGITLHSLLCNRESKGSDGSKPYIWPAMVWINKDTATVGVMGGPVPQDAGTVLKSGMHPGDTAAIPSNINVMTREFDDDLTNHVIILAIALWQRNDTPDNVLQAGYQAYTSGLSDAIAANLLFLNSSDQATVDAAIQTIKNSVTDKVTSAISNTLSTFQKGEIAVGLLTLDGVIDNSSTVFSNLIPTSFTVSFGGSLGGRLLFYRDNTQNGTGDVNTPSVIGLGGWQDFKFLFSGGNGIIYAVPPDGRLLFYRDSTQNGTGDVSTPSTIGLGGWQDFKFLFSGGNGIIYAVPPDGRLLFYRDNNQNGTGDVDTPSVIGLGGWADYKFLFSGGNGIIYAVDQAGRLLFYRDNNQDGTGDVDTPAVIGLGGWADFKFLFSGGNGIIYAVPQDGRLLFYRDNNQNGTGDVDTPSTIGLGGWADFNFLFSGGNGIIYAAEKAATPADSYEINGDLQVTAVVCAAEHAAVSAATNAVNDIKAQIRELQQEFQQAPASERPFLLKEIRAAEKEAIQAQADLNAAIAALQACQVRSVHLRDRPVRPAIQ